MVVISNGIMIMPLETTLIRPSHVKPKPLFFDVRLWYKGNLFSAITSIMDRRVERRTMLHKITYLGLTGL